MSAIAGFWAWRAGLPAAERCRSMLQLPRLPHADPRLWHMDDVALAAQSWPAAGESRATVPVLSADGRFCLVADLRLDNREDLLAAYGGPERPDLLPDERLLLALIEQRGVEAIGALIGDFAVALWDRAERTMLLARDLVGQRPLCYAVTPDGLLFASRPSTLHRSGLVAREPDEERLAGFVGLLRYLGPTTFYKGVLRVEPGHIVTITPTSARSRPHWQPQRTELRLGRFEEYRDAFREMVDRAVRSQLRGAGSTFATQLSSGWDSSTVTATAAREATPGSRIFAFTSVPRAGSRTGSPWGDLVDEGPIARATASRYPNIEHVLLPGSAASPIADLDRRTDWFQRPLYNLCNFVWLDRIRTEAAQRGARVLLTGELGNWTVSAAPPYLLADLLRRRRYLAWLREAQAVARSGRSRLRGVLAASFAPWVPDPVWRRLRPFSSRAEASAYSALHPRWEARIAEIREAQGVGLARRPNDHWATTVDGLRQYDFGDNRAGARAGWGIDERDPTADRRLIEFCLSLPLDMLLKNGERRPLARAALADRLPPEVLDQRHKGYQAADWHEGMTAHLGEIRDLVEAIARNNVAASLLDVEAMRRWLKEWPQGGWDDAHVMARYRGALLGALSAGHFILHASGEA